MEFPNGAFAPPDFKSMEVTGILEVFREPGKSLTKEQGFDHEIHHVAETTQLLLVLFDYYL